MKQVRLHIQHSGYCFGMENHIIKGGRKKKIKFHAMWALIEHPTEGYIIFDTGYTERFYKETRIFPSKIYAWITKVYVKEEEYVVNQIKHMGIAPEEIKYVFLSHFHADHMCGLKDFPNATYFTSKVGYDYAMSFSKMFGFTKGILKGLLPENFNDRVRFIEEVGLKLEDPIFGHKYDLFGDDSLHIYHLPGHAAGQMGMFLETNSASYFLIADACWLKDSFENNVHPNKIVRLFIHSWKDLTSTISKIYLYHKRNPDVKIIPSHCSVSTSSLIDLQNKGGSL